MVAPARSPLLQRTTQVLESAAGRIAPALVDHRSESQVKRFPALHGYSATRPLFHGLAPEGIGNENAVVPVMPPARTKILRSSQQADASLPARQCPGIVAPIGWLTPGGLGASLPGATDDDAAVLFSDGRGHARPKAHLLLVAEDKFAGIGTEACLPEQRPPGIGPRSQGQA